MREKPKLNSLKDAMDYCVKNNLDIYKRVGDKGCFINRATGEKHTEPLFYNLIGKSYDVQN